MARPVLIGATPIVLAVIAGFKLSGNRNLAAAQSASCASPAINAYVEAIPASARPRNPYFGTAISASGIIGLWAIGEYAVDLQDVIFTSYYAPDHDPAALPRSGRPDQG
ncbi:MAG: hypothetical protein U1E93_03315 [Alphaproteobacteria bacterium]